MNNNTGVNWAKLEQERESISKRAEMRIPIEKRYKSKAPNRILHGHTGGGSHISLGNGCFVRKNSMGGF
jgi:hypothetical protein